MKFTQRKKMNTVNLIGRIGKDIELKYLPSGNAVASFAIAIDQSYKDKNGQKVDKTSWIDIVAFRGAETINQFFAKGDRIGIQGELDQQTWQDQQGNKRSKIVDKCDKFDFIEKKEKQTPPVEVIPPQRQTPQDHEIDEDALPF